MSSDETVFDVLISRTATTRTAELPFSPFHDPPHSPVQIGEVTAEFFDGALANELCRACFPPGFGRGYPAALVEPRAYSFVRRYDGEPSSAWDDDDWLLECVALSRLIHPNCTGFDVSGRFTVADNGSVIAIDPGPCRGEAAFASMTSWLGVASRPWDG